MISLASLLREQFVFTPTPGQAALFARLQDFFEDTHQPQPTFLLRGYAGTGKTSVISALVHTLYRLDYKAELLAPTGRAAKVMSQYSGRRAYTIHRRIYHQLADPYTGNMEVKVQKNYRQRTLFIVDEASMITDDPGSGEYGILMDLIRFVFENPNNRLMLVGDTAQLPPVGQPLSPALDPKLLRESFGLSVWEHELQEVTRQADQSGILLNATQLRQQIHQEDFKLQFRTRGFRDTFRMTGEKLEDGLHYAYDKYGKEGTVIICRSNKNASLYNEHIRRRILQRETEVDAGEHLMIVRNNYQALGDDEAAGFLANGDFVEVLRVRNTEEMHGFRFATLQLRLPDYPDQTTFESKVLLDLLHNQNASLTTEEYRRLYDSVRADYADAKTKKEFKEAMKIDPYLNALQVKFAYALTCHKSQGGQWPIVFVDQGYLTEERIDREYLRWLYTAVTRATHELYFVNFHERFFESGGTAN
ncbi:exodeoxyribonuclease-5 [Catalinimonas alkaloidigena]|uniref:Exodeoxyribonuclease-5 n=1 Tax=Catalinimonas alkaloidigena TaxID=1075417 RepID=A0A1G9K2B9_9BACT|nr:AAA family ATPase [Catalinimonas alkaloidigena]SDL43921.1 exodeoxyribonuclease-5 [Catalinimonas alkaloidigena]